MKKVGSTLYVHKSNIGELLSKISTEDAGRIREIMDHFTKNYEVVKFNLKAKKLSLIESPNWDTVNEPDVGTSYCFSDISCGEYKIVAASGKIYHSKWMFVAPDYGGFDVRAAKRRTAEWNSIPDISEHRKKIGSKKYWHALLSENRIPV